MRKEITRLLFILLPFQAFSQVLFQKITTGPHVSTASDSRSVNFVDVNNDGWDDLFISNGPEFGANNFLYMNDGTGNFTAVSGDPIVSHAKPFDGASFADFDNDGDLDCFVVTWYGEKNFLYAGNGDGSFTYLGDAAPSNLDSHSETTSWGDFDLDGDLDLFLTNSFEDLKNKLYRNDGGQNFVLLDNLGEVTTDANASRSVNWVDYDNDGWPDLYVSNESAQKDDLYRNLGNGNFEKIITGAPGQTNRSSMSSSWSDVDNDGDLDLFVSNSGFFMPQNNQLFLNENGSFEAVTTGDLVTDGGCSFGSNFGDYDNDGDEDLVVSNGFCNGNIVNFLYQNNGSGVFERDLASIEDLSTPCSYGSAWGDVNNDGFLDLGIATCKNTSSSPSPNNLFYLNDGNDNNWLKIKLVGIVSNKSAIGTRVWVTATINGMEVTQMREISAQSGYCGQNSLTAHFGLGNATVVEEIKVKFPNTQDTTYLSVAPNQTLTIVENEPPSSSGTVVLGNIKLSVYPNPTTDTFQVLLENANPGKPLNLKFTDASGRLVYAKTYPYVGEQFSAQFSKKELTGTNGSLFLTIDLEGEQRTILVK